MKQSKQIGVTGVGPSMPLPLPAPQLEGIPEAVRPFVEMGMKLNSEFLELCGHRARAWLDWPDDYSSCKTTEDLTEAQNTYFTRMQHDYAHFLDGILRDTMIEQEEFEEEVEEEERQLESGKSHREAA